MMKWYRVSKRLVSVLAISFALYPGAALSQNAPQPKAPEAGEVQINQANVPTAAEVLAKFTQGVQEVEFRGLNTQDANKAFLSATNNELVDIAKGLKPGQKVDFRTADGQRFRIQNEDGQVRVRLRDVNFGTQNPNDLAMALSKTFGRVEIRGVDAAGNRIRLEMRDGVVKKNEVEADHKGRGREGTSATINNENAKDRGKDLDHSIRGRDRAELERERTEMERMEKRPDRERMERAEKVERRERMERQERGDRGERPERHGR